MWKVAAWIITTLLIPVVVFAYQRFNDDVRLRQTVQAEINVIEFEIAARLGQVSSSFIALVALKASPRQFHKEITSDWLENAARQLRAAPNVDMATPVRGVRILATPAAVATKDITLLGLFARGAYLHVQMLNFLELGWFDRLVIGQQVAQDFCSQKINSIERRKMFLIAALPKKAAEDLAKLDIADWRPSKAGVEQTSIACLKAWKYQNGIAALLTPESFVRQPDKPTPPDKGGSQRDLLIQFDNEFYRKLLSTVPDFDLPYVDVFAG